MTCYTRSHWIPSKRLMKLIPKYLKYHPDATTEEISDVIATDKIKIQIIVNRLGLKIRRKKVG